MMQGINTLYKSRYENEVMTLFEELLCMNLNWNLSLVWLYATPRRKN